MKNIVVAALVAGLIVVVLPCPGGAQYYGYSSPYFTAPRPPQAPAGAEGVQAPRRPLYYRMGPSPLLYWKWNQYNAYQDFQKFQRSPLNPESDLSYMLRTF
ncbi:MAG: hypothetical protein V1792_11290 [Pseudomonadota bacterium]